MVAALTTVEQRTAARGGAEHNMAEPLLSNFEDGSFA